MRLSTFILDNLEPILQQWEDYARSLRPGRLMAVAALRDDAEQMLRFVAADIETAQSRREQKQKSFGRGPQIADGLNSAAHAHGSARAIDHFTFAEMVSEYRALRAAVTQMWLDAAGVRKDSVKQLVRFNEAIDQVLAESVVRFAAALEKQANLFTASIGHDLRNPLSSIVWSSELLARSIGLTDAERDAVTRITSSANRMVRHALRATGFFVAEIAAASPNYTLRLAESGDTTAVT